MNLNYKLTPADIKTILFTLSILPSLELEDTPQQAKLNEICCISAAEKLAKGDIKFTANEIRVISASIQVVHMINKGWLEVDADLKKDCSVYVFDINRLISVFEIDFE